MSFVTSAAEPGPSSTQTSRRTGADQFRERKWAAGTELRHEKWIPGQNAHGPKMDCCICGKPTPFPKDVFYGAACYCYSCGSNNKKPRR
jgi:hypothetical protein